MNNYFDNYTFNKMFSPVFLHFSFYPDRINFPIHNCAYVHDLIRGETENENSEREREIAHGNRIVNKPSTDLDIALSLILIPES